MLKDGVTGLLVPPADPRALSAGLLSLLGDTNRAREMGEAARRIAVDEYGKRVWAKKWEDLYLHELGLVRKADVTLRVPPWGSGELSGPGRKAQGGSSQLEDAWTDLLLQSPGATVFASYQWNSPGGDTSAMGTACMLLPSGQVKAGWWGWPLSCSLTWDRCENSSS